MSMTENEAIKKIQYRINTASEIVGKGADGKAFEDLELAIKALEEVEQFRAIGVTSPKKLASDLLLVHEDRIKLKNFEAIGTVEEFKALKELTVTQNDIDAFKAYIDDCMDDVASGNTDWNHSLALALKCMELHKT